MDTKDKEEKPPTCYRCYQKAKKVWMVVTWYWYCTKCKVEVNTGSSYGNHTIGRVSWYDDDDGGQLD